MIVFWVINSKTSNSNSKSSNLTWIFNNWFLPIILFTFFSVYQTKLTIQHVNSFLIKFLINQQHSLLTNNIFVSQSKVELCMHLTVPIMITIQITFRWFQVINLTDLSSKKCIMFNWPSWKDNNQLPITLMVNWNDL